MLNLQHLEHAFHLVAAVFSPGWFYFPCVLVVLGVLKTAVGLAVAAALGIVAMMCILVARRRRAVLLQGLRRGFLVDKKNPDANINNKKQQQQKNDEDAAALVASVASASDLIPAEKQAWPPGAARMFEGSDIFYCDTATEELWNFFFSASSSSSSSPSSSTLEYAASNFLALANDVTDVTSLIFDGFQSFLALSLLSLIVIGIPPPQQLETTLSQDSSNHNQHDLHIIHRYFPTTTHLVFGGALLVVFFALQNFLRVNIPKLKLFCFAAVLVLFVLCGAQRHFPSNLHIFRMFFKEHSSDAAKKWDALESHALAPFRFAKRPLANPTACLLSAKAAGGSNVSVEEMKRKKALLVDNDDDDIVDEESEHVTIGDYIPVSRQWIVYALSGALFSAFSELALLRKQPLDVPTLPAARTAAIASFAPSVLMQDSVSHFVEQYSLVIAARAAGVFIFAALARLVSPMMSWEVQFANWLGIVYAKTNNDNKIFPKKKQSHLGLLDWLLVVVCCGFTAFWATQAVARIAARMSSSSGTGGSNSKSFFLRYPMLKNVVLLVVAVLLASDDTTFARSAAAVRGAGEKVHHDHHHQQQQQQHHAPTGLSSISGYINGAATTLTLGRNPWMLASLIHFTFGGLKCIMVPLLLFWKSEQVLLSLKVPATMVSLRQAALLDGGRAKVAALVLGAAWTGWLWTM